MRNFRSRTAWFKRARVSASRKETPPFMRCAASLRIAKSKATTSSMDGLQRTLPDGVRGLETENVLPQQVLDVIGEGLGGQVREQNVPR